MDFKRITYDVFNMFDKKWALATAGTIDDFDGCTIGWGSLGDIWGGIDKGKSIVTIYVNPLRYTSKYLLNNEYFTVSFFDEEYRKDLGVLGSKSKRDTDKFALTKLTPMEHGKSVIFKEATLTFVCKKIYWDQFKAENLDKNIVDEIYSTRPLHYQFIGEIVEALDHNDISKL